MGPTYLNKEKTCVPINQPWKKLIGNYLSLHKAKLAVPVFILLCLAHICWDVIPIKLIFFSYSNTISSWFLYLQFLGPSNISASFSCVCWKNISPSTLCHTPIQSYLNNHCFSEFHPADSQSEVQCEGWQWVINATISASVCFMSSARLRHTEVTYYAVSLKNPAQLLAQRWPQRPQCIRSVMWKCL